MLTDLVIEQGNPADVSLAEKMISRQQEIYGRVPCQADFDGGFASKQNLESIKALGVNDVAFAKKRGLTITEMAKSTWSGLESFEAYAWSSVVTANLLLMARRLRV